MEKKERRKIEYLRCFLFVRKNFSIAMIFWATGLLRWHQTKYEGALASCLARVGSEQVFWSLSPTWFVALVQLPTMASAGNLERMSREDWKKKQELDELVRFK